MGHTVFWQHLIADGRPEFAFFQLNGLIGFLIFGVVLVGT